MSWVAVTSQYVYGAWGDWRATSGNPIAHGSSPPSGELNSWIGRVPISDFTGSSEPHRANTLIRSLQMKRVPG